MSDVKTFTNSGILILIPVYSMLFFSMLTIMQFHFVPKSGGCSDLDNAGKLSEESGRRRGVVVDVG